MSLSPRRTSGPALLMMGGGLESSALAYSGVATAGLVVDYGQAPAVGERRAARAVAAAVGIELHTLHVDARTVGAGLLATGPEGHAAAVDAAGAGRSTDGWSPSPEWWPYRNQLLVTLAAAWAIDRGFTEILVGSVRGDAERHVDGSALFYDALDSLVAMQEGGLRVSAPAVQLSTDELLDVTEVPMSVLGYTHSCHIDDYACGRCPGCFKSESVLNARSAAGTDS